MFLAVKVLKNRRITFDELQKVAEKIHFNNSSFIFPENYQYFCKVNPNNDNSMILKIMTNMKGIQQTNSKKGITVIHKRYLMAFAISFFTCLEALAQFAGVVEQYPTSDYSQKAVKFNLTEVATQVGTDAATLAEAYNTWLEEEEPAENLFFLVAADGTLSSEYSANGNGFYITSEGAWGQWARDDAALAGTWFANATADAESDEFAILVGQYPDTLKAGDKVSAKFALVYGGKQATFEVSLSVIARPEIPAPTTLVEKDLNIVGEKEIVVEQFPRSGYDSDAVQLEIGDAVAKLGFESAELLADVLGDVLYCTKYNAGVIEEGGGLKMDELTHDFSASAPGFWLHAVQNEAGEETGECSQAVYGSENKFYADTFTFNAETGVITCKIGQYPGAVKDNEQWWVSVYLLRGDKAYRLKYTLKINEREHGSGVEGMNKVGEDVINAEISPDSINYTHVFIYPDINAIAAALGCEVGTFTMQALDETYNWGGSTASYGGFWFDKNGYVVSWENAACFYIEPTAANNYSILKVGQKPGSLSVGDKYSTKLYFVNENNYYQVSVNLTIIEREPGPSVDKMNKVGEDYINVDLEAASDYTSVKFSVDIEAIASALGVDVQYISMQALDENNNWANPTNNNDGFWFDMNGFVTSWGNTAYFYITPAEGYSLLDLGQYPNRLSAGATYSTKLYFVNGNNYYELIVILNVSGSNDDGRINGLYYNLISKAKIAEVINGSVMYSGNIVIPQTVEYEGIIYNVTSIGESAFRGSKISSVVMPNSIETIKSYAFQNCTNLSSVTIPNSVTSIGQSAFSGCI